MRIVGLPEFGSSVRRPSAAVSPAEKITPSQEVAARAREAEAPVATSQIASGREVPVDHERVAEIRKALEDGTYPLIPTEIADAIIASRLYGKVG
ncbi:MAG: flagellar biosynthesis anti-sigma factor FlgM [Pseudomonadota bacterium]|jgi:negative regulator of flagellin synthesis FlgM|uniref:Flagellar biosynthesis anti-sigma factor FlgM n=1 Tax=Qipengyuania flava TaxID=192812 RepID=A0A3T1CL47_9SPHN|nr:flagellar biosynthesis anti-sigma factor FlgM [Qipengyuania flava]MAH15000.1 hypothetical protein [Sphingomonadaceae bacterium]MEC7160931.1 flagellar biosynthesis anti-sigma factor FlgM [Pseudomonadota bacterium]OAN82632.1 hypothetical protein A8B77_12130 [Erythrobacter sp. EhN03]HCS17589.1 hypothetical protein [Erythrobacter sp.]MBO9505619.1 flagellar biosynthesis anti-sigma factor FlgM [Qipengyuania flava]|tara:strand:- start:1613 stop:1897 length:285 start_codon:yes stop_codon:yes gene_type:complete